MNFWGWPCAMFFGECTIMVAIGVLSVVILIAVAICMVAMSIDVIRKVVRK